jgi:hypothetical protein
MVDRLVAARVVSSVVQWVNCWAVLLVVLSDGEWAASTVSQWVEK